MNCLCCGKPLKKETPSGWHERCIQSFFGTMAFPKIEIDDQMLESLAIEATGKGYTVPGVQKKLSLHLLSNEQAPRLTLVNYPTGYILKPQVKEFTALPEAEHTVMLMAEKAGIATVPHALIRGENGLAYITKRIDRIFSNDSVKMLAMEDFCQLDYRLTQDKYRGSYERCAKVIEKHSAHAGIDMAEFYTRVVFSFLVGNSDMHLKNFSLIEEEEASGSYVLSRAYDLLPVNVIMPEDREQFALVMNGKKMNLRKNDFLKFADTCGIPAAAARKMIAALVKCVPDFVKIAEESVLPTELKTALVSLMTGRAEVLGAGMAR